MTKGRLTMKKDLGSMLALYPTPACVVGAMVDGKPDYEKIAPVLFEFPTYSYLATGKKLGTCLATVKNN